MPSKKKIVKKKAAPKKATKKAAAPKKVAKKAVKKAAPKKAVKKAVPKKATKKAAAPKKAALKPAPKISVAVKPVAPKPVRKQSAARTKQFEKIKGKLQGQKDRILNEAETAMNALPEQTVFPDLGDQASAETDRNFMLRLRGREQRLLNKIEEAIERIDAGDFGICEACGEEISFERLWARPVATLCIDCKLEQEEEEKLQGA